MYILELEYPGTWLDYEDQDWSWKVRNLISLLESQFTEATLALGLFSEESLRSDRIPLKEQWEADSEKRRLLSDKLIKEIGIEKYYQHYQEISEYVDIEVRRQNWEAGQLPQAYCHYFIFIYAKTFLYSVDSIGKILKVIAEINGVSDAVANVAKEFKEYFSTLHEIRNSSQHIEDRARGLDRNKKALKLKPIKNNMIHSEGGALILNCLNGNRYGNTMADGHYGEVEVSINSLVFIRDSIQKLINGFNWKGPKEYYPR